MSRKRRAKDAKQEAGKSPDSARHASEEERLAAPSKPSKKSKESSPGLGDLVLVSKALSDPTRVSILRKIAAGEGRCGDIRECLKVSAATLSHHMKELERSGLITSQREGRFVHAELDRKAWKQHIADLKAMLH